MTVASTSRSVIVSADGATAVFWFTFPAQDPSHITAQVNGATPAYGYTVTLNADQKTSPGGYVEFTSTLPENGDQVTILRTVPLTQLTNWDLYNDFSPEGIEASFDKLTMGLQQMNPSIVEMLDSIASPTEPGNPLTQPWWIDTSGTGLSLIGPAGPQGTQGIQGIQGIQGPAGPAGAGEYFVAMTANQTWTGTLQALTGMAFDVLANEIWAFDAWMDVSFGAYAPQFNFGAGPGGGATIHYEVMGWSSATVRDVTQDVVTWTTSTAAGAANGRKWYPVRGVIIMGSVGATIQMSAGPPSSASNTVYAGSHMKYRKLN